VCWFRHVAGGFCGFAWVAGMVNAGMIEDGCSDQFV
jgi:hypothetical protein